MNLNKFAMGLNYTFRSSLLRYGYFRNLLLILFTLTIAFGYSQSPANADSFELKGNVQTMDGAPLMYADIHIKDSFIATLTDDNGDFTISAKQGDVLVITGFLMKTMEFPISSDDYLSIRLESDVELLDAILLSQQKEEERIRTPFQKVKKRGLGYPTQQFRNKDFWPGDISVYETLYRNPLLVANNGGTIALQRSRGQFGQMPAMVILDDVPVDQSILQQLDPDQVRSVSVVRSLSATTKYGSLGSGGVIYVKSKNMDNFDEEDDSEPRSALVTDNIYLEDLLSFEETIQDSRYIAQLKSAETFEQAQSIYEQHILSLGVSSLLYYLEASDFFTQWDQLYSHSILSRLFRLSNNNPKVLLGIAYQCEQLGRHRQAAYVYQELMLLRPDHIQSYLDLAQVYTQIGNYKLASSLYRQMMYNTIPNMDFGPVSSQVITEYRRFLSKFRSKVNFQGLPNELLIPNKRRTVRIVFEWTNPLTEFEFQFVSPDKKFYNWKHTAFENKSYIESELALGYMSKDFIITEAARGDWIVNINRLSDDNENIPTFVKYTLYKNYGLPNEIVETKVVPLTKLDEKVTLDEIFE